MSIVSGANVVGVVARFNHAKAVWFVSQQRTDNRVASVYFVGTIQDMMTSQGQQPRWLIEPFLPTEGIVLLHGESSLGKTPLAWYMAQALSEGVHFFGQAPPTTGDILWIEADEPLLVSSERLLRLAPQPRRMTLMGTNPCAIERLDPDDAAVVADYMQTHRPVLVVLNSLNTLQAQDIRTSEAVQRVYGTIRTMFPQTCILVIHHDNKPLRDTEGRPLPPSRHDFSGSHAWLAQAQVALHLTTRGSLAHRKVRLEVTKSQVGALGDVLDLQLGLDGVTWTEIGQAQIQKAYDDLNPTLPKMVRYEQVATQLGMSVSTVQRRLGT